MLNNIRKLKQLGLELVFQIAFVKFTKPFFFHLFDLYCLQSGYPLIKLFLVTIPSSFTINEFTVKDSFSLVNETFEQDSSFHPSSLDLDSLFKNIPLEETINICTESIYDQNDIVEGLSKSGF